MATAAKVGKTTAYGSRRREGERGRISAMVPFASLAAIICVGIGVDFSGQILAEQDARDMASFCARQGVQEANADTLSDLGAINFT